MARTEPRKTARVASTAIVVALAMALSLTGCATPTREPAERAATADLALLKSRAYAASYQSLSAADRAQVARDDWIARCKAVEGATGGIKEFRVVGSRFLDKAETVVAVDVEVDFVNSPTTRRTALYYDVKTGKPVQTMLWGRTIDLAGAR
jgi:hypothetical protein